MPIAGYFLYLIIYRLYPRIHPPTHATHATHATHSTHATLQLTLLTLLTYINLLNLQCVCVCVCVCTYSRHHLNTLLQLPAPPSPLISTGRTT